MKSADTNANYFLSCDWGTTSFRLKLVDLTDGRVEGSHRSPQGIKEVYDLWSGSNNKQERIPFYYRYLKENISQLAKKVKKDLGGIPVVISGMASSSIGIKELPYTTLPVSLADPKLELDVRESTRDFAHTLILISGISTGHDVMRGEETQLIGLAANTKIKDGICIMPGTHSKHIFIKGNSINDFTTFMTGELFDLLSTRSILKNSVQPQATFQPDAFRQGIIQAQQVNLLNSLFKIRADEILHHSDPVENYYLLSGLLIGAELASLKQHSHAKLFLVGENNLRQLYAEALDILGLDHLSTRATDELAVEGQRFILNSISI